MIMQSRAEALSMDPASAHIVSQSVHISLTSDTVINPSKSMSTTNRKGACNAARVRSLARTRSATAASRMPCCFTGF